MGERKAAPNEQAAVGEGRGGELGEREVRFASSQAIIARIAPLGST